MNYKNDELIERLAAEYVIGTLKGQARARFSRLMIESFKVRQAVWEWENHVNGLAEGIDPVQPPESLWKGLQSKITANAATEKTGWFASINLWRFWSLAATSFVLILSVFFGISQQQYEAEPDFVAVFNDETSQPLWLVSTNMETGDITIKAINAQAQSVDKDYELWMLPVSGKPQSLGLLPVGGLKNEFILTPQVLQFLKSSKGLAVSVEPEGGSPTGLPTGPVVYQTQLVSL